MCDSRINAPVKIIYWDTKRKCMNFYDSELQVTTTEKAGENKEIPKISYGKIT